LESFFLWQLKYMWSAVIGMKTIVSSRVKNAKTKQKPQTNTDRYDCLIGSDKRKYKPQARKNQQVGSLITSVLLNVIVGITENNSVRRMEVSSLK
jgi:hypothetical protein